MHKNTHDKNGEKRKKKFLSVIYFIDAHKTRSFNISLAKLNLIVSCFLVIMTWSVLSILLVGESYQEKDVLKDRLHASLDTIFEYQSRYDGVYETAYPRMTKNNIKSTGPKKSKDIVEDKNKQLKEGSQEKVEPTEETETVKVALSIGEVESDSKNNWPVKVEDISFNKEEGDLELTFAIRNIQSPERAQGYIWSIVTLKDSGGNMEFMASPSALKMDSNGKVSNPSKGANWYSIRYYKEKSFYFHIPENKENEIHEISIGMMDLQGHKNIYKLPITKKILKKAQIHNAVKRNIIKG